jgi:ribosomal protein S18 acetylase RimI-like enzyme
MTITYRDATEADLPAIVALLADDSLGSEREDASLPLAQSYVASFRALARTQHQRLIVAADGERIIGTMQLLLVPALSSRGSWHAQIEAVRIAADIRGQGHGEAFVHWALEECRLAKCASVQLLSDKSRVAAHRFWRKLGFASSHVGFKMKL